jgi:hypothetical protein
MTDVGAAATRIDRTEAKTNVHDGCMQRHFRRLIKLTLRKKRNQPNSINQSRSGDIRHNVQMGMMMMMVQKVSEDNWHLLRARRACAGKMRTPKNDDALPEFNYVYINKILNLNFVINQTPNVRFRIFTYRNRDY